MIEESKQIRNLHKCYIGSNDTHALAALIKCKCCNGSIMHVNNKSGGYYGCCNAKRKNCHNKFLIPKKRIEALILVDLKQKFLTLERQSRECLLKNVQLIENLSFYVAHTSIHALDMLNDDLYKCGG